MITPDQTTDFLENLFIFNPSALLSATFLDRSQPTLSPTHPIWPVWGSRFQDPSHAPRSRHAASLGLEAHIPQSRLQAEKAPAGLWANDHSYVSIRGGY